MATTIDHLRRDLQVRVLEGFTDLNGIRHEAGDLGVIRELGFDLQRREIIVVWDTAGRRERMVFAGLAQDAPGIGRMKRFFCDLGDEPPPSGTRPRISRAPRAVHPPVLTDDPGPGAEGEELGGVRRVWALAAKRRFDEADAVLMRTGGEALQETAERLTAAAEVHADDEDGAVYEWLKERAIRSWYCWGSTATSGGEGAAMLPYIQAAVDRFKEIDRLREARPTA